IDVAPCESLAEWIQRGGRGLRISPTTGKTMLTRIDLHRDAERWGLLTDPQDWTLDGAGRVREGLEPLVQCLSCFAWGRGGACPCGAALVRRPRAEPRVSPAELEEVRLSEARQDDEATRRGLLSTWAHAAVRVGMSAGSATASLGKQYQQRYGGQPS